MIPLFDLRQQMAPLRAEFHQALDDLLTNTEFISGKAVRTFEEDFSKYLGANHTIACANGTDAITIALEALGVSRGDRILTVSHTFIATASAILHAGGIPEFVDVDLRTELLTPELLEDHLKASEAKGIRYRGLVAVHLRGNPCPIEDLLKITKARGMFLLEDTAQAHGARYKGKRLGTFGDAATFSFFPGKNLGALGDAGAVVTNSPELAVRVAKLKDHGRKEKYSHDIIGYNSRMDTIQAAWLSIKLKHLDSWNEQRRLVAQKYVAALKGVPNLEMIEVIDQGESVVHHFAVRCPERDRLLDTLKKEGIQAGVHYPVPVHLQPAFLALTPKPPHLPNTERISASTLSLPVYPELSDAQIQQIAKTVRNHCAACG